MRGVTIAARAMALAMTLLTMSTAASAQWLDHPTADIPRTA